MNDSMMDNVLVRQKDRILKLVNQGKFSEAEACLDTLAEMWHNCHYQYKTREIRDRIFRERSDRIWDSV